MIELHNLVVGYQMHPLTQPISGRFQHASLTAVMGANGAGKSTLLKTLAKIQKPLSGEVNFSSQLQKSISWLPQQADIERSFPISVLDVVAMGCWPKVGICRALSQNDEGNVQRAMKEVGIEHLATNTINQLSGGQFQRMLFARLLVQDAPIMLMDEPFVGIDSQTRDTLLSLISRLHQQGKTIIIVLHDMDIVSAFFPDILLIKEGKVFWGNTEKILYQQTVLSTIHPKLSLLDNNQFHHQEIKYDATRR